jgi:superfamily II DNA/RNA helicase
LTTLPPWSNKHRPQRQTLLFSATYPEGIEKIARQFMRDPQQIKIAAPVAPKHN